ncbi:aminotransferase class V-fold PLP-dependent enzyme [Burkholderia sp. Se-20373]|uniref:aminotransferase class V-fold PLP-dependent enzyme n=1 Tax=Burkholderia sp. Se-20373 TaxID=2703898 RepID=UPI00197E5319|nr:aminotransferase class V-fold PLP-dependent enzyme [Burkholderia sp. Se-20373]MBN3747861.1 aminotransferase class V-fold PLP-dependent enzyme [Burkholderia sp. Se-20373]
MSGADATGRGAGERFVDLDFNARTPVAPEVIDAMAPCWRDVYGNPSASHRQGRLARDALDGARAAVAALVGATPEWIVFTSGATEANDLALAGFAWSDDARAGPSPSLHRPGGSS